VSVFKFGMRG